ncbi:hypothetical protein N6H18_16370 [Reichenbachiella agarivorans]|uniref:Secreted protein n=1 Tax=Reichenbachiella agarivorans TaxID=2979464 RepID=A0ABY6CN37_9BACT|nr:hypothetical protein [Reichenbachiella agarivorans]UXP31921.1 hypothetical protein N6H18_16370 [Reichenbachiella agarivorans]
MKPTTLYLTIASVILLIWNYPTESAQAKISQQILPTTSQDSWVKSTKLQKVANGKEQKESKDNSFSFYKPTRIRNISLTISKRLMQLIPFILSTNQNH